MSGPPAIMDLFDYRLVLVDFLILRRLFHKNGFAFPRVNQERMDTVRAIVDAADQGDLELVNHHFGSGSVPSNCREGFDLIVNIVGPPIAVIDDQIAMLSKGGQLYMSRGPGKDYRPPDGYSISYSLSYDGRGAVIRRDRG